MAKLSLVPSPTFKAPVSIPVAGCEPVSVDFTFKHKTLDEAKAWFETIDDNESGESKILEVVESWDLEDELTAENLRQLNQNYIGSLGEIAKGYMKALFLAKRGN